MSTTAIIANGFGLLSTLCFIISFQIKSNKALFVIQAVANVFYCAQFYFLGALSGLFNMGVQILRNLLLCKKGEWKWLDHPLLAPLFCLPSFLYAIFGWTGPIDLLPLIASVVGTFSYWSARAKVIRLAELSCIVPAWLTYDLLTHAYGGILNESVILASVVISIFRFGWKGLDEIDAQQAAAEGK